MADRTTQTNRLLSVETPLGKDTLLINSLTASERISHLFNFDLQLVADGASADSISANAIIGQGMTVSLLLRDGTRRYFHGIVSRFTEAEKDERYHYYRAELVPWLWLLTLASDCRVFQNRTVPEIIKGIFDDIRKSYPDLVAYKDALTLSKYAKWDYCVQYRETDYNFVSRLMEQEGIFYFFTHEEGKHTLVLADSHEIHKFCPDQPMARYRPEAGIGDRDDTITDFRMSHALRPSKYVLRDYHFEMPGKSLEVPEPTSLKIATNEKLEVYDYPGEYAVKFNKPGQRLGDVEQEGRGVVKRRMQEEETPHQVSSGSSDCRAFGTGHRFELIGHWSMNGSYVMTSLHHSAAQSPEYVSGRAVSEPYRNTFTCIPFNVTYRPPRLTPRPVVMGSQTAVVVGPAGEEIFTDRYGRVKVQFHWDREGARNENSSCWTRVAQIWAGKRWGASFWPRIGQEVVVAFEEGDPDRPIVIGSVYNAEQMPPYLGDGPDPKHPNDNKLSGIKSNTTKGGEGFNELRFDDTKDKEQVFIHAERNMDVRVKASHMESVGGGRHLTVGGNFRQKVAKDKETIVDGEVKTKVKGKHNLSVDGEYVHFNTGKVYVTFDSGYYLHTNSKVLMEAVQEICLSVGPSFIKMTPAGIWITGPMVFINSGGAASTDMGLGCDLPVDPAGADDAKSGSKSAPDR